MRRLVVVLLLLITTACGASTVRPSTHRLQGPTADQGCTIRKLLGGSKLMVFGGAAAVQFCNDQTGASGDYTFTSPGAADYVVCTYTYEGPFTIQVIDDHEALYDDDACGQLSQGNVP